MIVAVESRASGARPPSDERSRQERRPPHAADDILLSAHYACTHCGMQLRAADPQLFSFNSPQGMCLDCDGLGERYSFDPDLLVPDPTLVVRRGLLSS